MNKQIPKISRFRSMTLLWRYRNFIPALGAYYRDHVGGIVQYDQNGQRYFVTDPELTQKIMKSDYRKITKPPEYDELRPYQGNGMVVSKGNDWIKQRRWSAPFFLRA